MPSTSSGNVTKNFAPHDHDIINMYPYNINTIIQVMRIKKKHNMGIISFKIQYQILHNHIMRIVK